MSARNVVQMPIDTETAHRQLLISKPNTTKFRSIKCHEGVNSVKSGINPFRPVNAHIISLLVSVSRTSNLGGKVLVYF